MKRLVLLLLAGVFTFFASCEKNTMSKVPHISLVQFVPKDSMRVNIDSAWIVFSFTDGDADIANDTVSGVWVRDSRYESFLRYNFPEVDGAIEDPKKGLSGTVYYFDLPIPRYPEGDTLFYELYVTDRAGNASNHIQTNSFLLRP
jgi:hypothetical protein